MEDKIVTLLRHAEALRKSGVTSLEVDGLKVTLLPERIELEPMDVSSETETSTKEGVRNIIQAGLPAGQVLNSFPRTKTNG